MRRPEGSDRWADAFVFVIGLLGLLVVSCDTRAGAAAQGEHDGRRWAHGVVNGKFYGVNGCGEATGKIWPAVDGVTWWARLGIGPADEIARELCKPLPPRPKGAT